MNIFALVFSTGWASGVNAYLVVLILGLADRIGHFSQIPDQVGRLDVLIGAGLLYSMEFVADKIPYIDSTWDAISTFIRPTVATAIAALVASDQTTGDQIAYAAVGGFTALASHSVKSGSRLALNASPEPVSNVGASLGEDVTVAGVITLAIAHPYLALGLSATFLVVGLVMLFFISRSVRRGWRRWKGKPVKASAREARRSGESRS